ncbi:hypothetical protein P691DRAFT_316859 [Macrolepiota fuliginosa MF-IS2]|uniref:Uncharacterized protein n=1 Tax=Macrolepiota fuliginosa MF-IS2 TaxID=1400762 RepID=A0A9P5XSK6_9AGAR|nr:hypothetical protein P691DRAFT_316859 [Macrolepiota fuliginosa MF-IS2]
MTYADDISTCEDYPVRLLFADDAFAYAVTAWYEPKRCEHYTCPPVVLTILRIYVFHDELLACLSLVRLPLLPHSTAMSWWIISLGLFFWIQRLFAQKSQVTCVSSFHWAQNDKGQDPCTVAALVQASCRSDTNVTIKKLSANEIYVGPDQKNTNDTCACNSVVYSLLSACAACQDRFYIDWQSWTRYCATSYLYRIPGNISSNIVIPSWAYNVISVGTLTSIPGSWNPTLSLQPPCNRFDLDAAIQTAISGEVFPPIC